MPARDKNPHKVRMHLPIVGTNGNGHEHPLTDTHVAHSVGCAQTAVPTTRRPDWLRVKASFGPNYKDLKGIMRGLDLNTVCEEAGCPNIYECWEERTATFMILGDRCTRACGFCLVDTRRPLPLDARSPAGWPRQSPAWGWPTP